jgi:hypothetical protein
MPLRARQLGSDNCVATRNAAYSGTTVKVPNKQNNAYCTILRGAAYSGLLFRFPTNKIMLTAIILTVPY